MWEKGMWPWHLRGLWERMAGPYKDIPANINLDWTSSCADTTTVDEMWLSETCRGQRVDAPWLQNSSREVS